MSVGDKILKKGDAKYHNSNIRSIKLIEYREKMAFDTPVKRFFAYLYNKVALLSCTCAILMLYMVVLSINESLFYVPSNCTGVISVCNNRYGNEFVCIVSGTSANSASLAMGDSVCIKMLDFEDTELVHEFIIPNFFNKEKELINDTDIYGMEVSIKNNVMCIPFINGGAVTFVVTINRGAVSVDVGAITADNILLDYYNSVLNIGDEICVTFRKLDFISLPLRERHFSNCTNGQD